ncbi:Fis family transcriptional regulator [Advenella kashmirensis W13003]|uniref:Fis family transcriptional regulator n=1 Tax=Advenella kashmirensis W13003 TaxID=1424334 RepID=V8QM80_9BURK|nr:sigma-54-dependent Fis family transcriptional regulator [Advenella kashmirensis]ETF00428.1 Fis family transcriptional regulator [Advenella kashmirensis W13003]
MYSLEVSNHIERINQIVHHGAMVPDIDPAVASSWGRCVNDYGLDPESRRLPPVLTHAERIERAEQKRVLITEAKHEMNILYQQLADPELAVVLVDTDGCILHMVAADHLESDLSSLGLRLGAVWSEEEVGTNGMGTCLIVGEPIAIRQTDHFLYKHILLTCSAVPVMDHTGKMIAVLDVTSRSSLLQQHSLVLIGMTARMIENRLLTVNCKHAHPVHFHSRPESINTVHDGKLMVEDDGTIVAANQSALVQLGFPGMKELRRYRFDEIFQSTLEALLQRSMQSSFHPVPIYRAGASSRFFAVAQLPPAGSTHVQNQASPARPVQLASEKATELTTLPCKSTRGTPQSRIELGDTFLREQFELAQRVVSKGVPVLLYGETGSGKEVLAHAVHHRSPRHEGPFVAVNCASLPESLIESELFGYRAGAFTGAQRQGRSGKILQAHGGTLLLDEIGDMPLALQARLLRVLDERKVTPLGADTSVDVDIQLISASHRNLSDLVARGQFREDLYYRLNGVEIRLPPLRERQDKRQLIDLILEEEAGQRVPLADDVLMVLMQYAWPGNLRQMRHVLRTMAVLADGATIGMQHLPGPLAAAQNQSVQNGAPASCYLESMTEAEEHEPVNPLQESERITLIQLLETHRWNISDVARTLGVSRNTLYRKLHRHNITLSTQGNPTVT